MPTSGATEQLAQRLAPCLRRGDVLAMEGSLGAGKTAFTRALLQALGAEGEIPSPTFTLVQTYDLRDFLACHFDLYRLKDERELDELGWDDALAEGLTIVEWPDRAGSRLPENRLVVRLSIGERCERHCEIEPHGAWQDRLRDIDL